MKKSICNWDRHKSELPQRLFFSCSEIFNEHRYRQLINDATSDTRISLTHSESIEKENITSEHGNIQFPTTRERIFSQLDERDSKFQPVKVPRKNVRAEPCECKVTKSDTGGIAIEILLSKTCLEAALSAEESTTFKIGTQSNKIDQKIRTTFDGFGLDGPIQSSNEKRIDKKAENPYIFEANTDEKSDKKIKDFVPESMKIADKPKEVAAFELRENKAPTTATSPVLPKIDKKVKEIKESARTSTEKTKADEMVQKFIQRVLENKSKTSPPKSVCEIKKKNFESEDMPSVLRDLPEITKKVKDSTKPRTEIKKESADTISILRNFPKLEGETKMVPLKIDEMESKLEAKQTLKPKAPKFGIYEKSKTDVKKVPIKRVSKVEVKKAKTEQSEDIVFKSQKETEKIKDVAALEVSKRKSKITSVEPNDVKLFDEHEMMDTTAPIFSLPDFSNIYEKSTTVKDKAKIFGAKIETSTKLDTGETVTRRKIIMQQNCSKVKESKSFEQLGNISSTPSMVRSYSLPMLSKGDEKNGAAASTRYDEAKSTADSGDNNDEDIHTIVSNIMIGVDKLFARCF